MSDRLNRARRAAFRRSLATGVRPTAALGAGQSDHSDVTASTLAETKARIVKALEAHGVEPCTDPRAQLKARRLPGRFVVLVDIVASGRVVLSGAPHTVAAEVYDFVEDSYPNDVKLCLIGIADDTSRRICRALLRGPCEQVLEKVDDVHLFIALPGPRAVSNAVIERLRALGRARQDALVALRYSRLHTERYVPPDAHLRIQPKPEKKHTGRVGCECDMCDRIRAERRGRDTAKRCAGDGTLPPIDPKGAATHRRSGSTRTRASETRDAAAGEPTVGVEGAVAADDDGRELSELVETVGSIAVAARNRERRTAAVAAAAAAPAPPTGGTTAEDDAGDAAAVAAHGAAGGAEVPLASGVRGLKDRYADLAWRLGGPISVRLDKSGAVGAAMQTGAGGASVSASPRPGATPRR